MLAVSYAVSHFRDYIEGQSVTVRTDHKPLVAAFTKGAEKRTPLQKRHLNIIAQYVDKLHYLEGEHNVVADACSRIAFSQSKEGDTLLSDEDFDHQLVGSLEQLQPLGVFSSHEVFSLPSPGDVFVAQQDDYHLQSWIQRQIQNPTSPFKPKILNCSENSNQKMWFDTSSNVNRILTPTKFQRMIFDHVHGLAHVGVKPTIKMLSERYFWPEMKKHVRTWVKSCLSCQKNKIGRHTRSKLVPLPEPTKRFAHIHVDLVGPINPVCEGKNMLLTIVDRWSGWPEAIPMSARGDKANAKACAVHLVRSWIARFGVPHSITSDRGPQFISKLWQEMSLLLGIKHVQTSSYHPQHNGKVERFHKTLKNSLRCRLNGRKNWMQELPWALLGLRSLPNDDTGITPAVAVYGQELDLPGQLVAPKSKLPLCNEFANELSKAMSSQSFSEPKWHGGASRRTYMPEDLMKCAKVLVRIDAEQPSLNPKYQGPFDVIKRYDKVFVLQFPSKSDSVSVDRLIPFYE